MLKTGDLAPDFKLPDQTGSFHSLNDYRGKWLILYFYPKDMTSGCTAEACSFRDEHPDFTKLNAVILGVSKDSIKAHTRFAEKYSLPFALLSDEQGQVCEKYNVWQEKSLYGRKYMGIVRTTYLINPQGKIARIYPKVQVKGHSAELLRDLNELS